MAVPGSHGRIRSWSQIGSAIQSPYPVSQFISRNPSGVFISMSVPSRYVQKWAPWEMTPSRNAWPWTRLPMSRPCMSVKATTIVSIRPSRTMVSSSARRGCLVAWPSSVIGTPPHSSAHRTAAPGRSGDLLGRHPAIRDKHRAGDERRLVRREEQRDVGDLARLAGPADRLERVDVSVDLVEPAEHLRVGVVDGGVDPARGDGVAADALLGVVEGDALREHDDRPL